MNHKRYFTAGSWDLRWTARILVAALLAAVSPLPLAAQDQTADNSEPTIEELYLQGNASFAALNALVLSNDTSSQLRAVRMLRSYADRGLADPDSPEYLEIAIGALQEGVTTISNNRSPLPDSYDPIVRMEAARALAVSHSPEAQTRLFEALENDPEPSVHAAVMRALGERGEDPDGTVSYRIARSMRTEALTRGDESKLYAGLVALESIVNVNGTDGLHELVRESVIEVANGGFSRRLREKAIEVLILM